jgi:hypothetical protein
VPRASWDRTVSLLERVDRAIAPEGSTRALGLLRILLVLVLWSRWANEVLLMRDLAAPRLALSVAFFLCTSWLLIGLWTRAAAIATAAVVCGIVFGFGRMGGVEDWTHHHTTLLAYASVGLALTPCGRSFSLDRWREVRASERAGRPPPPERGSLFGATLLGALVSTVYFWSALDKTSVAFLSGARLEQVFIHLYTGSDGAPAGSTRPLFAAAAWIVVLTEYALAFGLWVRRLRRWLIPVGLALHGLFYVLIPVSTFTVSMWVLYLVFLDPDAVHRAIDRLLGHAPQGGGRSQ